MTDDTLYAEAIDRFAALFQQAAETELGEPAAVTLATADATGQPFARIVLLRCFDKRGFVFFTNANSDKGDQLAENPRAALCFYWDPLHEQVRVTGGVQRVTEDESDQYWQSRARESQLGAWASLQSEVLEERSILEQNVERYQRQFAGGDVPRPPHWHGFRIVPHHIEFWSSQPARLHERVVYERGEHGWTRFLLHP